MSRPVTATTTAPSDRAARGQQPMVTPNSPRGRCASNAWSRHGDGHRSAPAGPATVSTSAVRTPAATPTVQPRQPPAPQPPTIASEPPATVAPPPTTRAPISVSPESRAPFPNQTPPRSNDERGGLLGGVL
jgi:hypothetical protein